MSVSVARLLLAKKAVALSLSRPFTWASGIRSPIYCDNRLLLSYPLERQKIIRGFVSLIRHHRLHCDGIAGVATAGIPHAALLADRLKKPLIYVRSEKKGHGKGNQIEGRLDRGSSWIVIEDLMSTGGSSAKAVQAIRRSGGKVVACLAIFTYGLKEALTHFQDIRCPFYALTDLQVLMKEARRQEIISHHDQELLCRFQRDPHNWR